ncbi:stearoyl-CoA desaturase 5 [Tetranychus urticae]|uniref:Fatty acid desaturase domain-containing protein n=1 Tax=Tetranychus urticae TaxID=32264 RepID=T1JQ29_TETUR|nr:stearoyl-CoA desaturase 5 [Tetranychus urticae]
MVVEIKTTTTANLPDLPTIKINKVIGSPVDQPIAIDANQDEPLTCCSKFKATIEFIIFDIRWIQVIYHLTLIGATLYGITKDAVFFSTNYHNTSSIFPMLYTWAFGFSLAIFGSIGLSAGCHRLWSHHAYKAKLFMRILLALMFTSVAESTIYYYVKHHRAHHVFIDTHADPQNVHRGFCFAQLGWRFLKPRPEYRTKVTTLDFQDALNDPVVKYQKMFFPPLALLLGYVLPTIIPYYLWGDSLLHAFLIAGCVKSCSVITVHGLLGSVSHMYGKRRYNKKITARDIGLMSVIAAGEGYHNFHHTFPYDYTVSEFGQTFNISKLFIDFFALFGQAYNLRKASPEFIEKAKNKTLNFNEVPAV